jgi:hypothetical protein
VSEDERLLDKKKGLEHIIYAETKANSGKKSIS